MDQRGIFLSPYRGFVSEYETKVCVLRRGGTPGSGIQCFEIAESDSHAHTERTSRRRRNMGTPENPVS